MSCCALSSAVPSGAERRVVSLFPGERASEWLRVISFSSSAGGPRRFPSVSLICAITSETLLYFLRWIRGLLTWDFNGRADRRVRKRFQRARVQQPGSNAFQSFRLYCASVLNYRGEVSQVELSASEQAFVVRCLRSEPGANALWSPLDSLRTFSTLSCVSPSPCLKASIGNSRQAA